VPTPSATTTTRPSSPRTGWVTGSEWNWGPLYTDIVETVRAGDFAESDYNGDFRVGLQTGDNPFVQSEFGSMVDDETKG
jgi:basic membrane protein A and related proteins